MIPAKALSTLPDSVDYDPLAHKTIGDLAWAALIELDLIEEDQDGAVPADAAKIRKWLRKWSPETLSK